MKPVGLTNPHRPGEKPHAVVQLRQDNALGTLWNMVGFQTKLKHGEQVARVPHHPGPRAGGVRPARRAAPQHLPEQPEASRRKPADSRPISAYASPGRSRRRGLCQVGGDRAAGGALRRRRAARRDTGAAAADHRARRAAQPHHRRASQRGRRGGCAKLPADERQFRAVPADRGAAGPRGKGPRSSKGFERKRALSAARLPISTLARRPAREAAE